MNVLHQYKTFRSNQDILILDILIKTKTDKMTLLSSEWLDERPITVSFCFSLFISLLLIRIPLCLCTYVDDYDSLENSESLDILLSYCECNGAQNIMTGRWGLWLRKDVRVLDLNNQSVSILCRARSQLVVLMQMPNWWNKISRQNVTQKIEAAKTKILLNYVPDYVQPICIADNNLRLAPQTDVFVAGWGQTLGGKLFN